MQKFRYIFFIAASLFFAGFFCFNKSNNCTSLSFAADNPSVAKAAQENYQVTFLELGSVSCIPCKMMQPIMDEIEKEYAGKVKVVFHDVWTAKGKPYAKKYGIKGIPTQIFLDKNGKEFFRHTGFFSKAQIVKLLEEQGVTK
ncbi:thioredoxin family protein [Candidatus Auribacterota bacterium]